MSNAVSITVSLKDSTKNPPKVKIKDSEGNDPGNEDITTKVDAGATVTWIPDLASGITSLTGIRKKKDKGGDDLLDGVPTTSNGNLVGKIVSPSPGKDKKEKYEIGFKIDGDSNEYWTDPVLQMRN